jgi:hypothetical protein
MRVRFAGSLAIVFPLVFARSSFADDEVSRGKDAWQSSTAWGGDASRAVDGNTDGFWDSASTTHTDLQWHPWWQVDLGATYNVSTVDVYNRLDCCTERLTDYVILVSNRVMTESDLYSGSPDVTRIVQPGNFCLQETFAMATGRFVMVGLPNRYEYLSLAEVKVFGSELAMSVGDFSDRWQVDQGLFALDWLKKDDGEKRRCPGGKTPRCVRCVGGSCFWACAGGTYCSFRNDICSIPIICS